MVHGVLNDLESKIYNFIFKYPPRRLAIPPIHLLEWGKRRTEIWDEIFKKQVFDYLEWVYINVQAENTDHYSEPGTQFKNKDGTLAFIKDDEGKNIPVINQFPDYLMDKDTFATTVVSIVFIPIDQLAKWAWGGQWKDLINSFAERLWIKVKEFLKFVENNIPTIGAIFLGVAGLGVALLAGADLLNAEINKNI